MTKRELVVRIANETEISQHKVADVLQRTLDYIIEALANGHNVEFRDFGVFEVRLRKKRIGRNPNKPENTVVIPERRVVKFKAGKIMKSMISKH